MAGQGRPFADCSPLENRGARRPSWRSSPNFHVWRSLRSGRPLCESTQAALRSSSAESRRRRTPLSPSSRIRSLHTPASPTPTYIQLPFSPSASASTVPAPPCHAPTTPSHRSAPASRALASRPRDMHSLIPTGTGVPEAALQRPPPRLAHQRDLRFTRRRAYPLPRPVHGLQRAVRARAAYFAR
eukprot:793682-Pleurochrysis_carterae.AAC.2